MLSFVIQIFISVFVIFFFYILPDFSTNIFLFTQSRLQTIYFVFSDPADSFFPNISRPHPPPQKNNGPSVRVCHEARRRFLFSFLNTLLFILNF